MQGATNYKREHLLLNLNKDLAAEERDLSEDSKLEYMEIKELDPLVTKGTIALEWSSNSAWPEMHSWAGACE